VVAGILAQANSIFKKGKSGLQLRPTKLMKRVEKRLLLDLQLGGGFKAKEAQFSMRLSVQYPLRMAGSIIRLFTHFQTGVRWAYNDQEQKI
jgi:hypothetical protein